MDIIIRPDILYFRKDLQPVKIKWGYSQKSQDVPVYIDNLFAACYMAPPETFQHSTIEEDLELDVLVDKAFKSRFVPIYIKKVLAAASNNLDTIKNRQETLEYLVNNNSYASRLDEIANSLYRMIGLFIEIDEKKRTESYALHGGILAGQIKLLVEYTKIINSFSNLTLSPIDKVLSEFARIVQQTPEFQELERYTNAFRNKYVVTIEAIIDAMGDIHSARFADIKTDKEFTASWLHSRKGFNLFCKLGVDDYKIISKATETITQKNTGQMSELTFLLGPIDFYLSALNFYKEMELRNLPLEVPNLLGIKKQRAEILGMKNPLLFYKKGERNIETGDNIVPNDIVINDGQRFFIITGPNSGGKTVNVKGIGLCYQLAQNGLRIPVAKGSCLSIIDNLYTVLVTTEKLVDTAGGQLEHQALKIKQVVENATQYSLVLLDEIGRGTSEKEGVDFCGNNIIYPFQSHREPINATVYFSTHLHALAEKYGGSNGIINLQAEIKKNQEGKLEPTYKIIPGRAEKSYAYLVEQRIGLGKEKIDALLEKKRN